MVGIILAAGLGSRCSEITKVTHKALININGRPNIENNIEFLNMQGVDKIYIVVGYLKEQFYYLKDKYSNVELIVNDKYREYNNIYSMYLATPYFDNGIFVVEADVVIHKNFKVNLDNKKALYLTMLRDETNNEWLPVVDDNGFIKDIVITNEHLPVYIGLSYYSSEKSKLIKDEFENYIHDESKLNLYWDDVFTGIIDKLNMEVLELPENTATEIDNYNNYLDALKVEKESEG